MPPAAARTLLAWIGPGERLRWIAPRRIAGRAAAGAQVVSGEPASSVSHLDLWVDPGSGLPLELDVYVRGSDLPAFSTRFLDVSLERPDPAVLAPVLTLTAPWAIERRDLLSFIQAVGNARFPAGVSGLPLLGGPPAAAIPAGIALYGTGFARIALLQLPRELVPRIERAVGAQGVPIGVDGSQVAVLRSPLLQVALLEAPDGSGYLLAGALTSAEMDAAVRSVGAGLTVAPK